ncbi:hypothetical protein K502DRAFT_291914, partial [Neoconidiobolus thromboides FSU 785]
EDILTLMIKASMEEDVRSIEKGIHGNIVISLLGDHGTTAFPLSATLHFLAQNSYIQEKLHKE